MSILKASPSAFFGELQSQNSTYTQRRLEAELARLEKEGNLPPKRGRGRPPGSKNKKTLEREAAERARQEAETEQALQKQSAVGNRQQTTANRQPTANSQQQGVWYFYNPQAVSQGKQTFQQQWGKRENQDNWQRANQTVVSLGASENQETTENLDGADHQDQADNPDNPDGKKKKNNASDEAQDENDDAQDPHKREYYLAQIPFTEEQLAVSHDALKDGLYHAGIIVKDKLDNLQLGEKMLTRLTTNYPDYEHNDVAWYHLFLLYSRMGRTQEADRCLAMLKNDYPESEWTTLLDDPNFVENQRFGIHIEDSIYAATYDAFKANHHMVVKANTQLSAKRFPKGQHRPKFLFIEGLSLLNDGDAKGCAERMQQVVEQYPQSEVSELAGMIIRGIQQGRQLHGGRFDINDIWSRRAIDLAGDSTLTDTLTFERNVNYVFLLAYQPDSVNQNQLLYELAKYNFSNYLVRNFDIASDQDANGLCRMLISGFLSYDEALQYARQLYSSEGGLGGLLRSCRSLIISEQNLRLLGTSYSYRDYEEFYEREIAPVEISKEKLLDDPESITQEEEEEEEEAPVQQNGNDDDDFFNNSPTRQQYNNVDDIFDDDFWR